MKRWPTKPLNEIATVVRGVSFDKSQVSDEPRKNSIPILRAGNIQDSLLTNSDLVYVSDELVSDEQIMKCGDLAICMSSGSPAIVGKTAHLDSDWHGSVGAFCAIVRFSVNLHHRFGSYWFRSPAFLQWRDSNAKGANIQNLRRAELEKLPVPVPPLIEQERLVKLLDEANELRKLRAQSDRCTAALIPALFHEMFGDPATNPNGWPIRRLGDLVLPTEQRNPKENPTEQFFYVDIASVDNKTKTIIESKHIIGADAPSRARKVIRTGDVIVSTVRPNLNAVARIPDYLDTQICSTGFSVLRPSERVISDYLFAFVLSYFFINCLIAKTTGANYPAVNDSEVKDVPISVPPLPLQKEFAARVTEIRAMQADQSASRNRLDDLFQSMLHRAFNGEL